MKETCAIVADLLPLYQEKMLRPESAAFVDKHLADCHDCQLELLALSSSEPISEPAENLEAVLPLQKVKKTLRKKRLWGILSAVLVTVTILTLFFSYLTAPKFIPWSAGLITTEEVGANEIGFKVAKYYSGMRVEMDPAATEGADPVAYISFYTTTLDEWFHKPPTAAESGTQRVTDNGEPISIYYGQLGDADEPVHLYGPRRDNAGILLPRLALSYYLIIVALGTLLLSVLAAIFRQRRAGRICLHLALLGGCYLVAQVSLKGFRFATVTLQRDLSLVLLVTVLLLLAVESGWRFWAERKS